MLRGEVGVGLTTLLDYALRFASDMRIVRTPGAEAEQHLAFAGVHSLCHAMPGCLDELPGPHRDALASAFGLANRGVADPFLVGQAVLALLSTTADDRPLLCVIDDAQWLDKASVNALAFVARRLSGAPVAMLLAAHDTRGHRSRLPNISVGALPDDTARELLASIVDGPLDRRVRERIVQETGGIPLGLVEVTARLSSRQLAGIFELPDPLPNRGPCPREAAESLRRTSDSHTDVPAARCRGSPRGRESALAGRREDGAGRRGGAARRSRRRLTG